MYSTRTQILQRSVTNLECPRSTGGQWGFFSSNSLLDTEMSCSIGGSPDHWMLNLPRESNKKPAYSLEAECIRVGAKSDPIGNPRWLGITPQKLKCTLSLLRQDGFTSRDILK